MNYHGACYLSYKKAPNQTNISQDFIKKVSITLEKLWMVSDGIADFKFFLKFHRSGHAIIFSFWTITDHVTYQSKKASNQTKIYQDLIKMVSITQEGLWMVSDRIADFQFFVKFHRSGPAKIFSFWTIMEYVSYPSKKLLIKQKTSSRRWVLLWKDYGWFLIELSILDFSSNFTVPDMQ